MPPFWTDERDKTLLLLMLGPDRIITRAQAAEIAQMMGAPAAGDTIRYVLLDDTGDRPLSARAVWSRLVLYFVPHSISWRYFDFPFTNFENSHHPALLHTSDPATSSCLSLYGTMLETDAFYFIFLTRPHLSPKLGLPRSHKNWALRHQETRAGRFWINYPSPVFYVCLHESIKPPAFRILLILDFPSTKPLPCFCFILATLLPCDICRLSKDSTELIMPGPWDHETDRKLLLCLVDPNLKPKWADVATDMGSGFTSESVRYVFWKVVE